MVGRLYHRLFLATWSRVGALRPLLSAETAHLNAGQRATRVLMTLFLAWPDARYRRYFKNSRHLLPEEQATPYDPSPREGVLLMIGTLGPGGAERQLVATAKAIKARALMPVGVACVFLDSPAQRFFLPELETAGIPTSIIGAEREMSLSS